MKKALASLALLLATALWAQQQTVKVFTVKPANVERINRILKTVVGESGSVALDPASSTLVVTASPAAMPTIAQVVAELDATSPSTKNVELTLYILEATKESSPDSGPIPAELQPAIAQIKSVFAYQGFRLLDTTFIRTRSGESADANGQAQVPNGTSGYHLTLRPFVSSEAHPATIRIDNSRFQAWMGSTNVGFSLNLDLTEGQMAVVGKAGIQGSHSALILVASGKVLD